MTGRRITADWIGAQAPQKLFRMLEDAGHEALFVGGCVRNALLGAPISDVDIATDATPSEVIALSKVAGFHPVPTGEEHGTITVVVDGEPFEITTYRKDVETDGRRAVVTFAKTSTEDAHRRDFTMNALYATAKGEVIDPLGGLADLDARRFRFIDKAEDRIREDYLRILRFFRFHAWYGDPEKGLDPEALDAIARLSGGIDTLSRERVGSELLKLLSAPDPAPSVAAMDGCGVLRQVLPGLTARYLPVLVHLEGEVGASPNPLRRLSVLGGADHQAALRLSKTEGRYLDGLLERVGSDMGAKELGYRAGPDMALDVVLAKSALLGSDLSKDVMEDIAFGAVQQFPIGAKDLMPEFEGAALGAKLSDLEDLWIGSGFLISREKLLENL